MTDAWSGHQAAHESKGKAATACRLTHESIAAGSVRHQADTTRRCKRRVQRGDGALHAGGLGRQHARRLRRLYVSLPVPTHNAALTADPARPSIN